MFLWLCQATFNSEVFCLDTIVRRIRPEFKSVYLKDISIFTVNSDHIIKSKGDHIFTCRYSSGELIPDVTES